MKSWKAAWALELTAGAVLVLCVWPLPFWRQVCCMFTAATFAVFYRRRVNLEERKP